MNLKEYVVENAPGNLYWKDVNGKYMGCNQRFAMIAGFTHPEDIIGKSDKELFAHLIGEEDVKKLIQNDKEVIEKGIELIVEESGVNVNGELSHYITRKIPLRNEYGFIIGVIGASIDISEHAETSDIKDYILLHTTGNLYWKDKQGRYLGCNIEFSNLLGLENPKDIIGKTDYDLLKDFSTKSEIETILNVDKDVIQHNKIRLVEESAIDKNGQKAFYITKKTPIKNSYGQIVGLVGNSIDITDRVKAEEALKLEKIKTEAVSKAKSEFIANMSHDIRTPITGIIGMIQDLLNLAQDTEFTLKDNTAATKENLLHSIQNLVSHVKYDGDMLMRSIDQLLQLCNEILEVTRLENGMLDQPPASFDVYELVQHNVALLQPVAKNKKLILNAEIDETVPRYLTGLRNYLDRTLLNLTSNALKFTEKGFVKIKMKALEEEYDIGDMITLNITIEDTGIGIPEDKFDVIFENFSRLTPAYEGIYKGSGLGLYTVKHYVEAMKGTIKVESQLGIGTCFKIMLPLMVSNKADHPRQPQQATQLASICKLSDNKLPFSFLNKSAQTNAYSSHVLIVEDSQPAALALTFALKPFDCAIDIAENGKLAIEKVQHNTYDLILMDVGLPDISGIEVTKNIRSFADAQKARIPIVALTGHADNEEKRQECLSAGMQEVLSKPTQMLALQPIFEHLVFNKKMCDEKQAKDLHNEKSEVIIDWEASLHMCGEEESMLQEVLDMLSVDLADAPLRLKSLLLDRNVKVLQEELNHMLEGIECVRLPKLEFALKHFQKIIHQDVLNTEQWQPAFENLTNIIRDFQAEWEKCS